jgi:hypothetical protein
MMASRLASIEVQPNNSNVMAPLAQKVTCHAVFIAIRLSCPSPTNSWLHAAVVFTEILALE